jgi:gamma-glutamylcyclotransferase
MDDPPSTTGQEFTWYFAYGSNLSKGRMEQRTGTTPLARTAYLQNHRLAFNLHADGTIFANILPCHQSIVWGAAYWCSREMMDALDRCEGVAIGCYRRSRVEVETENGERLQAEIYVGGEGFVAEEGQPSEDYLQLILTGAEVHSLPEQYIRFVAARGTGRKS